MAIIAQVRAFEHINFNKNCGVDEFTEDFLASDAAMNPETESGRFACAKRPYLAGAEGLEFDMTQKPKKTEANKAPEIKGFSQYGHAPMRRREPFLASKGYYTGICAACQEKFARRRENARPRRKKREGRCSLRAFRVRPADRARRVLPPSGQCPTRRYWLRDDAVWWR